MNKNLSQKLLKTLLIYFIYIFYNMLFTTLFGFIGINDNIIVSFISDLIFLSIILYLYKDNIKNDFNLFVHKFRLKGKIFEILKYIFFLFLATMIVGIIKFKFFPNYVDDENASAIVSLFSISAYYTIFKILIFASIAEEVLFKEALKDVFLNKFVFVIMSSLIYATMNIIYSDLSNQYLFISFLSYFLASTILATAYVKNDNNIFLVILIKFCYNLIPTILLILGAF